MTAADRARRLCSGGSITPGQAAIVREALDELEGIVARLGGSARRLSGVAEAARAWRAEERRLVETGISRRLARLRNDLYKAVDELEESDIR